MGTGVWGRGGGLAPALAGPGDPGGVTNAHYLFLGFVNGRHDFGAGVEEPAVWWLPQAEGPRPFAPSPGGRLLLPGPERWPGGPGEGRGAPCALPATIAIPEPQCFLVWGPGPGESTRLAAAIIVSHPVLTLHHKGFLWSPVP